MVACIVKQKVFCMLIAWVKGVTWGDTVFYDSKGKVVDSGRNYVNTYSSSNWNRMVPDTIGEGVSQFICSAHDVKSKSQTK